jgi:Protein of unknown function (DUF2877)
MSVSHQNHELIARISGLGWRARDALHGHAGQPARVLAALSTSLYVDVGGEILWIGGPGATAHARTIHVVGGPPALESGDLVRLPPVSGLDPWRPGQLPRTPAAAAALRRSATRLASRVATLGAVRGFGAWLLGAPLPFPLGACGARADMLARACAANASGRAVEAALALVGMGPGLTPAGDDFTGGAFFARAVLARVGGIDATGWHAAADAVRKAAAQLTHRISATLLGDLLAGEGWAPLHDLAMSLAYEDDPATLDAARRLTQLGHSSGWDLLAGFIAGARV